MDGIVLAGAKAPEGLWRLGIDRVPLLKVQGVTILERTCRALLGAGCEAVYVLAPPELPLPRPDVVFHAAYSGDVMRDMFDCLELRVTADNVIVSSADMPLVNVEAVRELVDVGRQTGADIVYPAVERQALELCFPDTKRTYLRLGRQVVTGGNAIWLRRSWLLKHKDLIWRLFQQRKSIPALARFFGLTFLIRILLGYASIEYVESYLSRLLQGKLRAAVLDNIELGIDLDKVADLETLRDYIDPWEGSAQTDSWVSAQ
jgi:molybdopterin-guanine dinucleotide biosynthesis protein A